MERIEVIHEVCRTKAVLVYAADRPNAAFSKYYCPLCRHDLEYFEIVKRYFKWELIPREYVW